MGTAGPGPSVMDSDSTRNVKHTSALGFTRFLTISGHKYVTQPRSLCEQSAQDLEAAPGNNFHILR